MGENHPLNIPRKGLPCGNKIFPMEAIYSTDQELTELTLEYINELLEEAPEALDVRLRHFLYEDIMELDAEAAQDEEEFVAIGDPVNGPWVVQVSKAAVKAVSKLTDGDLEELASGLAATNEGIELQYTAEDVFYQLEDFREIAQDAKKHKKKVIVVMNL